MVAMPATPIWQGLNQSFDYFNFTDFYLHALSAWIDIIAYPDDNTTCSFLMCLLIKKGQGRFRPRPHTGREEGVAVRYRFRDIPRPPPIRHSPAISNVTAEGTVVPAVSEIKHPPPPPSDAGAADVVPVDAA